MPQSEDRARVKGPPPLYMLLSLVLGVLIHRFLLPLPFEARWWGLAPALGGFLLGMISIRQFVRIGESVDPGEPNHRLVNTGPYQFSRNPIYLGFILMQVGVSLLVQTWWGVLTAPLTILLLHSQVVIYEEAYLERQLGQAYLEYKKQVRRWI